MKIFVAGATGTLGRPVVRLLLSHGHEVVGLTRSEEGRRLLLTLGAHPTVGDALDAEKLRLTMLACRPDQVVHLLTALPPGGALRPRQLRPTNQLRIAATANIIAAAIAAGAHRLIAESFVGVYGSQPASTLRSEAEPLPPITPGPLQDAVLALRSLEDQLHAVRSAGLIDTVALRIGLLYGPDVPSMSVLIHQAIAGRLFFPRNMPGVAPFVEISDAATAIVAAVEHPKPSEIYNIVDDEPIAVGAFLAEMSRAIGAPPPRHVPGWLVKLAAPVIAAGGSAQLLLSNAKAKRELGWSLRYPTVRDGLADLRQKVATAAWAA
jgi:nucleoside-diphosphate-sugar epimerase